MAVQLTEFCPPLVERTNERGGSPGTRNSESNEQDAKLVSTPYSRERDYIFFFFFFLQHLENSPPPFSLSLEKKKKREREEERKRKRERVSPPRSRNFRSNLFPPFGRNSRESIWKIRLISRDGRVSIEKNFFFFYFKTIVQSLVLRGVPLIRPEKENDLFEEMFVFFFFFSPRIEEPEQRRSSFKKKGALLRDSLSLPFLSFCPACSLSKQ